MLRIATFQHPAQRRAAGLKEELFLFSELRRELEPLQKKIADLRVSL
jgi:hypothetical protein